MSNETRRAIDYWLRALTAGVRDGLRIVKVSESHTEMYNHIGPILRRMRGDLGLFAALIRETQKDAEPVRRRRRKRRDGAVVVDASAPTVVNVTNASIAPPARKPRAKRNAEPPATAPGAEGGAE